MTQIKLIVKNLTLMRLTLICNSIKIAEITTHLKKNTRQMELQLKPLKSSIAIAIALSSLSTANIALAAEDDLSSVERITVRGAYFGIQDATSVKTPTALVNVPQSLSIVSLEQIEAQGFASVADVMQYIPGVSVGLGEDHRDQITIRGQNTTADFFIDGLRDDVQYFRPLYNLERVEVLRGANALLFGRGGGGGIVNRVSKEAKVNDDFTTLGADINSFGAGSLKLDYNNGIDSQQGFRLNAMVENIDNHRDFKEGDRYAFNPTYTIELNSDTKLVASYEYVDDDRLVDRGIPSSNGTPLEGVEDTYFGDPDFNRTTFEGHIARTRLDHIVNDTWSINTTLQFADYDKLYQNIYPAGFDANSNEVKLDGYIDTTKRENIIMQFNAIGHIVTGNIEHTLLVGAEYGKQDTNNNRRDTLFFDSNDDQIWFTFSDPLNIPGYEFTGFVRDRASEVTFSSAFVQDEMQINDWLILVAGLRYDHFEIDVIDTIEVNDGIDDGNSGFISSSDSEISPRLGAIIKPNKDLSLYASYSKSFLPRSGDQFLTLSLTSAALDAEEFENKELGLKWNVNDSLSLTAAAFEVIRENGSVVDPNNPENSLLTGTETTGFEIQLVGHLSDDWTINAGYSSLDGEETGRVANGVVSNRTLAQLPENMFTLWSEYELNDQLSFGLGLVHQSEQYASLNNTVELPDFTRVDAAVYYAVNDNLDVQLNIENLFDEEYYPSAHNDNNISTGKPVNARLSLQYSF